MPAYLQELTIRLASSLGHVDDETRQRHTDWIWSCQRNDGGFSGREGSSDLYYTAFALRTLAMTGELFGDPALRVAQYLSSQLNTEQSIVDLASLIYAATLLDNAAGIDIYEKAHPNWRDQCSDYFETLRRDDGGYARTVEGGSSSTYNSFLVLLCRELIERPLNDPEHLIEFIMSQQSDEGGFREIRVQKRGGTNPTAAAIGVLKILAALPEKVVTQTVEFLAEMQNDEGGLRANSRIPIADILSTFTGFLTLQDLNGDSEIDKQRLMQYANSLEQQSGGFLGAAWDKVCDVEYTFYGLGTVALLTNP
ncbi:MAG: beta-hydroxylase [Planctomycetaceae bacterium]|jgi:geranylgeranyl transferase type-2 subunit beta|nr:beta-hydroxylase [Planctomycetaceae bacterium]MBT6846228.1 beta-hydroxylase [Planctomycetaceae bacterium]